MHAFLKAFHRGPKAEQLDLSNLRIASPCPADWEKMVGDARVRHCAECNLNVYNLSAMTKRQIQQLIAGSIGKRLCTRFYRRADGTVLTQDCPWSVRAVTRKGSRVGAAVLTAIIGVTVAMARNKPQPATCKCNQSQQKDTGIRLTVVDQHGAVIPKAEITLEKNSGEKTIAGATGPSGEWNQTKMLAGRYRVTVKSPGFSTFTSVVDLRDGTLLGLKVKLPVAAVNTTVEVKTEPGVVMVTTVGVLTEVHQSLFPPAAADGRPPSPMRP
jgi:Carboxypeptidase regulatory-like domain